MQSPSVHAHTVLMFSVSGTSLVRFKFAKNYVYKNWGKKLQNTDARCCRYSDRITSWRRMAVEPTRRGRTKDLFFTSVYRAYILY